MSGPASLLAAPAPAVARLDRPRYLPASCGGMRSVASAQLTLKKMPIVSNGFRYADDRQAARSRFACQRVQGAPQVVHRPERLHSLLGVQFEGGIVHRQVHGSPGKDVPNYVTLTVRIILPNPTRGKRGFRFLPFSNHLHTKNLPLLGIMQEGAILRLSRAPRFFFLNHIHDGKVS
jgi:hypothetical protein